MQQLKFVFKSVVLLLIVMLTISNIAVAQPRMNITATGYIIDSKTSEPLYATTVKVTSADGGTGTFGITDSIGKFEFIVNRPGKYTLDFSYVGYKPLTKEVRIFPGRGANLGKFKMEEDAVLLQEVGTVARSQRVKQVGDTVVYNADAYKVVDGASAEDLVAKMPGIEVTDEGVKAQGETVEKITVDGKAFFENDPKLALKTLPAEVVQSVSVFDKKSDQAEFTGFDDGNTVKAMDLTTKSYRRNGAFGKVYGSGGFDTDWNPYYNAGFNLNLFNGDQRISLLGMSNNVNQQDFSFDDLMSSGGMGGRGGRMQSRVGRQSGVSRANAFGLNFNNTYLEDKLDVQGSYFFNMTRTTLNDSISDDYINMDRASIQTDERLSHNYSHRVNMRITYKPNDENEFMFRPRFNFQKTDADGLSDSRTWRHALDSVITHSNIYTDSLQNSNTTHSVSDGHSWNAGGMLLWRHKMAKEGRTLSIHIDGSVSGSESNSHNEKLTTVLGNSTHELQGAENETNNYGIGGNIMWTEPISDNQQLSIRYDIDYTHSSSDRMVEYFSESFDTTPDSIDGNNSNQYTSDYLTHRGELGYRLNSEYVRFNASLGFQNALLEGEQNYIYWNETDGTTDPSYRTSKSFNSILPRIRFEWMPKEGASFNIDYNSRSNAPSISNLQQSVNTTNELAYSTGNANLSQSVNHNVRLRFIYSNMERATNLMLFAGMSFQQDYIGTQYVINNSDETIALNNLTGNSSLKDYLSKQYQGLGLVSGARISRPVNMSGYQTAFGGLSYGFPFDLLMSNVNVAVDANYSMIPSQQIYYMGVNEHGIAQYKDFSTKVRNLSISPRLSVTSNISQDLDFSLSYRPSFQKVKDTKNDANNYDYLTHSARANFNWVFWKGFTIEQSLNFTLYTGSSMARNEDDWTWNASIGKKFGKNNAAEIKLQAYDILNSHNGYTRSVSDSYIRNSYVNYMPRYFMLNFSYKIAQYKGVGNTKESRRARKAAGAPDMMPPQM